MCILVLPYFRMGSLTALLVEENISIAIDYFLFSVFILREATSFISNYKFYVYCSVGFL